MSVRTYLDKIFFHKLREAGPEVQQRVVQPFAHRRYSCYLGAEMLEEMIALWETSRAERLAVESRLVLDLMHEHMFKYYGDLVVGELRDGSARPFVECSVVERARHAIQTMASGSMPDDLSKLPRLTRERKESDRRAMANHKEKFLADLRRETGLQHSPHMQYEEFRVRYWARWVDGVLKGICERGKIIGADTRIGEMVAGSDRYPFTNAAMRTHIAVLHQHFVTGRAADNMYDAQQIVYLTQLDLLITDDERMKEMCEFVHGTRIRVMTFQEFVNQL